MKSESEPMTSFALISDVHLGPDRETVEGSTASRLLDDVVSLLVEENPAFVVDLGDRINDVDGDTDRANLEEIARLYSKLECPVYFAFGNHDVINLTKEEQYRILPKRAPWEVHDIGDALRIIVLDSMDPGVGKTGGAISEAQLEWLTSAATTGRDTIVFVHHPIDRQDVRYHWYFGRHPDQAGTVNGDRAIALLTDCRCQAIFNGHVHWINRGAASGIPTVNVPSFIDTTFTRRVPPGFFTSVEHMHDALRVRFRTTTGTFMEWELPAER